MCLYKYEPLFLDPPRVNDGKLLESKLKNWVVLAHYSCIPLSTSLHERIVFSQYCGKSQKTFPFFSQICGTMLFRYFVHICFLGYKICLLVSMVQLLCAKKRVECMRAGAGSFVNSLIIP